MLAVSALSLLMSGIASSSNDEPLGDPVPFENPFTVTVSVLDQTQHLMYWAEPLAADELGKANLELAVKDGAIRQHIKNPFVIQFRLAGIDSGPLLSIGAIESKFSKEIKQTTNSILPGKMVVLHCRGYYEKIRVPYCDAYNQQGQLISELLVVKGYAKFDETKGEPGVNEKANIMMAQKLAQSQEIGIWMPLHSFFHSSN
jgi:hypothetical protein